MEKTERVGISLEKKLLADFDKLIAKKDYQSRSEAVRDLIRQQLSSEQISNPKEQAVAVVAFVYDHHATELMKKLTHLQHSHLLQTISSLHVHLDEHDCMEVIILRGKVGEIEDTAQKILSTKGVKLGKINLISTQAYHQV